jgi:hypothetical protein
VEHCHAQLFWSPIATDKLCFIVSLAREFDVKDVVTDPHPASNPTDDAQLAALEDHVNDPSAVELRTFIDELDVDEQIDLVALVWLGRGDGERSDWTSLRTDAADAHNDRTADYLMGMPLLADFLLDGMNAFNISCEE